jgi:hypothetical protein
LKHNKYIFDIPIPFCHNLYLSATLKQFLTEFAARYNLLHHVYMSIPGRIPTCDLIGRLFLGKDCKECVDWSVILRIKIVTKKKNENFRLSPHVRLLPLTHDSKLG